MLNKNEDVILIEIEKLKGEILTALALNVHASPEERCDIWGKVLSGSGKILSGLTDLYTAEGDVLRIQIEHYGRKAENDRSKQKNVDEKSKKDEGYW